MQAASGAAVCAPEPTDPSPTHPGEERLCLLEFPSPAPLRAPFQGAQPISQSSPFFPRPQGPWGDRQGTSQGWSLHGTVPSSDIPSLTAQPM